MLERIRSRLTYANVVATLALFIALGTGSAYAANTIGSSDVIDGSLTGADIQNESLVGGDELAPDSVGGGRIRDGGIKTQDIFDGTVGTDDVADNALTGGDIFDGSVGNADLGPDSVGSANLQTDSVKATEIANDSIDAGEIIDFGLTNQDVGVLFAQVNADGTIANSSGGVTGTKLSGLGTYEVDFGRTISGCAFSSTQGEAGTGGATGAIMGVTDRSGNAEAVFATVRTNANALVDRAFQLVVVC
jgi:hypothetical protein